MKRSFTALITLVAMARAVAWEIVEKPGFLRVANDKIAVELTSESQQPAGITLLAADANGAWKSICRTLRPDFSKAPAANKLFDSTVTPHRYQANEMFGEFSIASRTDKQVKIKLRGKVDGRVVAEQTLSIAQDSPIMHVDVSATLVEPLLDYFLSSWEFMPPGNPDFVHSPTAKKDDLRSGPAMDQVRSSPARSVRGTRPAVRGSGTGWADR